MNINTMKKAAKFGMDFGIKMSGLLVLFLITMFQANAYASTNWNKVKDDISLAAYLTDFPAEELAAVAFVESSFRVKVKSPGSSASGLTQITSATWDYLLEKYGPDFNIRKGTSPFDPRANSIMAAMYLTEIKDIMSYRLKRETTLIETYLGYKFSPYRAVRMLQSNPNTPLLEFYPEAAERNEAVYYHKDGSLKTIADVKLMFKKRLGFAKKTYGASAIAGVTELKHFEFMPFQYAMEKGVVDCVPEGKMNEESLFSKIKRKVLATVSNSVEPINGLIAYNPKPTSGREYNGFLI